LAQIVVEGEIILPLWHSLWWVAAKLIVYRKNTKNMLKNPQSDDFCRHFSHLRTLIQPLLEHRNPDHTLAVLLFNAPLSPRYTLINK
jgi:hypothetical protein